MEATHDFAGAGCGEAKVAPRSDPFPFRNVVADHSPPPLKNVGAGLGYPGTGLNGESNFRLTVPGPGNFKLTDI